MTASRVAALDWSAIGTSLGARGFAPLPPLLTADDCAGLVASYENNARFRSVISMERFRFGAGEYKYFAAPLPPIVQTLRTELYARLAPIANGWMRALRPNVRLKPDAADPRAADSRVPAHARLKPDATDTRAEPLVFPDTLDEFLAICHQAGQSRPTPLLLSYREGGYNCLHQDIYGALAFPLQVVFVLSRRGEDYAGGELLLVEQRPRAQSRGHAIAIDQGAGVVFATRERPAAGARGSYRVVMRHGVSTITSGSRMSLGVIFHDAK